MAKTDAYSIFTSDGETEEKLIEIYASIVDQIQKSALSVALKNSEVSGDPQAGSVVVRRLQTSLVRTYGTARTAGEGDKILNNGVTVNLDQRKEIVYEVNNFDVQQFGIPELISRRQQSFALSMASHLDTAFFTEAEAEGSEVDLSGQDTTVEKIEYLIQDVETTSNSNVDGVDRSMIVLTVTPETYGLLENYIDTLPNPSDGGVRISTFHGVKIFSNHRQTEDAICMVMGSVSQPVAVKGFKTEEIPLSNETAMKLFFNYGTEAVMSDLIKYGTVVEEEVSA